MFTIVEHLARRSQRVRSQHAHRGPWGGRGFLVIDEGWKMLERRSTGRWINEQARRSRHHRLFLIAITQQLSDFTQHPEGAALVSQSSMQLFLSQVEEQAKIIQSTLGLTDQETETIAALRTVKGEYAEAFLCNGRRGRGLIEIRAGAAEYWLATSEPDHDQPLRQEILDRVGGDPWAALDELAANHAAAQRAMNPFGGPASGGAGKAAKRAVRAALAGFGGAHPRARRRGGAGPRHRVRTRSTSSGIGSTASSAAARPWSARRRRRGTPADLELGNTHLRPDRGRVDQGGRASRHRAGHGGDRLRGIQRQAGQHPAGPALRQDRLGAMADHPGNSVPQYGIDQAMLIPLNNARAAVYKYRSQGLTAWTTYTSGAYIQYLHSGVGPTAATVLQEGPVALPSARPTRRTSTPSAAPPAHPR